MNTRKLLIGLMVAFFFSLNVPQASADKSAVKIEAPDEVIKGSEAVIKLQVSHDGNNLFHYTDWVVVRANGEEIGRWEYSMTNRPEDEKFTKEITVSVKEDLEIEAEAHCNLHGSAGIDRKKISAK